MQLAKWQRNTIFEAIDAAGLDARECTFDYDDTGGRITHVPSESSFLLEGDAGHYTSTEVVGEDSSGPSESFSWTKVQERVRRWAEKVKQDVDTPDLWGELQREREILTGPRHDDVENTPFTSDEREEIAEQLRQIKELVKKTYSLSEAQMLTLEAKIDDLEAAAGRIGRKDWRLLFCGVMFTVIVTGLLSPEAVQHILVKVLHGLENLFGGGPPQLPPLT